MQEIFEFRIPEEHAKELLRPMDGVCLGGSVRKVVVAASEPLVERIREIDKRFRAQGRCFFLGWNIRRGYSKAELQQAMAFTVIVRRIFEPAGEECGTVYDDLVACKYCGSGERHVSDLILDPKSLPRNGKLAIAKTIAGEVVVSDMFVEVFQTSKLQGAEFLVVKQRQDHSLALPGWHQLLVTSEPLITVAPTQAGIAPFDDGSENLPNAGTFFDSLKLNGSWCDREGQYRCPLGHTIGLNLLSELSVDGSRFQDCDIALTKQRVGVRRGLLRPERLLVISQRLRKLVVQHGLKGMNFEVVHLKSSTGE